MRGSYYINKEKSWILYNERILSEATDDRNELFERIKFLSISASNLDEFFMVRVAGIIRKKNKNHKKTDISGLDFDKRLELVKKEIDIFLGKQYFAFSNVLLPLLEKYNIWILSEYGKLSCSQKNYVDRYFDEIIYPVLKPVVIDFTGKIPLIKNKLLNIGTVLENKNGKFFGIIELPKELVRVLEISQGNKKEFILIEEIIKKNIKKVFCGYENISICVFRVTRDSNIAINEDIKEFENEVENQLNKRKYANIVRLEIEENTDVFIVEFLKKKLKIKNQNIYYIRGKIDLSFLIKIYEMKEFDYLKNGKYIPSLVNYTNKEDIFKKIRKKDILMYHPYDSFSQVLDLITQAANDDNVMIIKQTVYRLSENSKIIEALIRASKNGKCVIVFIEVKARFDEEKNLKWARKLKNAGCYVIYKIKRLKNHCKMTLIVRMEKSKIRRYVHIGTGNYNEVTAKSYTDISIMTCDKKICEDVDDIFNMIFGCIKYKKLNKLIISPYEMRNKFINLINREIKNAKSGKKAHIIVKMNSLSDRKIIKALYEASYFGVKIELIVRGVCCLKPGIKGISDNISVHSIVGRFLEHGRIYYFENNGNEDIYISSADWQSRNFDKRLEVLCPIEDVDLKRKVKQILRIQLADMENTYVLKGNVYEKVNN